MGGPAIQDGERFGRLTTASSTHKLSGSGRRRAAWVCRCDCGGEIVVESGNLRSGNTRWCRSCSSAHKSQHKRKHGHAAKNARSRAYKIWCGVKDRTQRADHLRFSDYGGRGIDMCPEWAADFTKFLQDMGEPPTQEHTLERVDNGKGYWPGNCVWATPVEQGANKRNNVVIEAFGEKHILAEWARKTGLKSGTIAARLAKGWLPESAVSFDVHAAKRKRVWHTPEGDFGSLADAAAHHGLTTGTAFSRFKSPSFPDWNREKLKVKA